MTNHPVGLEPDTGLSLTRVLELPATGDSPPALALIGVIGEARRCGLLPDAVDAPQAAVPAPASAPPGRCGRLLAVGDPSIFINLMFRYPGNRAFAERVVEYLVGDDTWGRRGGTLYILANTFTQEGTYGGRGGLGAAVEDRLEALSRLISETRREGLPTALAVALAALAVGGAALWAMGSATRRYRRTVPRYARPTPLVAQGGLAGRAAVLSAETTHRALVVLELKAALEEALRDRLALDPLASPADIVKEIDGRDALSRTNSAALGRLFAEMAEAEAKVARTERIRVAAGSVRRMHEAMTAILTELDQRLGRHP